MNIFLNKQGQLRGIPQRNLHSPAPACAGEQGMQMQQLAEAARGDRDALSICAW